MKIWQLLFGSRPHEGAVIARMVDVESLGGDEGDAELLQMELDSTRSALDISDKECDDLADRLNKAENCVVFLDKQRSVVSNDPLEAEVLAIVMHVHNRPTLRAVKK